MVHVHAFHHLCVQALFILQLDRCFKQEEPLQFYHITQFGENSSLELRNWNSLFLHHLLEVISPETHTLRDQFFDLKELRGDKDWEEKLSREGDFCSFATFAFFVELSAKVENELEDCSIAADLDINDFISLVFI